MFGLGVGVGVGVRMVQPTMAMPVGDRYGGPMSASVTFLMGIPRGLTLCYN